LAKGQFDLITNYSFLHHPPECLTTLQTLSGFLKKGGIIYIDHEASPFYWEKESSDLANFVKDMYFHSNPANNSLIFQLIGLKVPTIDYTLSDYWHKKEHAIDHQALEQVFTKEGFEFCKRTDYYQKATWTPNPLFSIYRLLCRPEMCYWIAKR
jgi:ubiquinone/menaquinone biosynthesis C-methylase UbiE